MNPLRAGPSGRVFPHLSCRPGYGKRLRHQAGQVIVGDDGFAGRDFEAFIAGLGAVLLRPDRRDEPLRFDTLKGQLTLELHGGRTLAGVYAGLAARPFAPAAGIWHNRLINATRKRSLAAYDH